MKRITNLPQSVLRQILSQAQTRANTLSSAELAFAKRICDCCACGHLWIKRGDKEPRKCPKCFSTQWNLPTLRAFAQAEPTTVNHKKQEVTQ